MPMGKGTYGSKIAARKSRPKKKSMLTAKQKTLPEALKKKIVKSRASSGSY